jgi:gliding motility-associated-like protein
MAQPTNDGCNTPIQIPASASWCSPVQAYTSVAATPSGYGPATCFGTAQNDVWFQFTATATDVTITINGNQAPSPGGSLTAPQVALYLGTCGGTINQLQCASSNGANIVDLYKGGLVIGQTYLIRVQGRNGSTGTFQLCLNNYNAPVNPGSDCITGAVLCDKSPFVIQSVTGAGQNNDEAAGSCLSGLGTASESNSVWLRWTCDQAGSLTFTLTPNNASDDLDFVLYELPNGLNNCNGKRELRCMAAGDFTFPSPCMGPTGLRSSSTDITETAGCGTGKDNFVAAVNMVAGRSYALLVNNFSQTGSGFRIEFGGTGTFVGPRADFTLTPSRICAGETVQLRDASSFPNGSLTAWTWNFGTGSSPSIAASTGPHTVRYTIPGRKSIALTVASNLGCIVTKVLFVDVDSCCQTVNDIQYTTAVNNVQCPNSSNGSIALQPTNVNPSLPYRFSWSSGQTQASLNGLNIGSYRVTITNGICTEVDNFNIIGPPPWDIQAQITRPTCDGGRDGAVRLSRVQGSNGSPYQFNWNGTGFGSSQQLLNLPNGNYPLLVRDRLGCDTTLNFRVQELAIELDSVRMIVQNPLCFQDSNGRVQAVVANGLPPYRYQWSTGATTQGLLNLPQGQYTLLQVQDANRCVGGPFVFNLQHPPLLELSLVPQPVRCFGELNGQITALVQGGTYPYTYRWAHGARDSVLQDLSPGVYQLQVDDANGCRQTRQTLVDEPPAIHVDSVRMQPTSCFGGRDGQIQVFGSGGRPDSIGYRYAINRLNHFLRSSPVFDLLPADTHRVYIVDAYGCSAFRDVIVRQPAQITIDAGPDRRLRLGDTIQLEAIPSRFEDHRYRWSSANPTDNGPIDCDTCRRTFAQPYNHGWFYVQMTSPKGCEALDSFKVLVEKKRNVFIPNVFSPNGDGVNDRFQVYGGPDIAAVKRMMIFDRWGELLYESEAQPLAWAIRGWDGRFKGQLMPVGVYVYVVEVEFLDGYVERYVGDLTMIY